MADLILSHFNIFVVLVVFPHIRCIRDFSYPDELHSAFSRGEMLLTQALPKRKTTFTDPSSLGFGDYEMVPGEAVFTPVNISEVLSQ